LHEAFDVMNQPANGPRTSGTMFGESPNQIFGQWVVIDPREKIVRRSIEA
jgi:hypothetical protein